MLNQTENFCSEDRTANMENSQAILKFKEIAFEKEEPPRPVARTVGQLRANSWMCALADAKDCDPNGGGSAVMLAPRQIRVEVLHWRAFTR